MSFDNSRIIFNSWKDYLGMITLQGRVQVDSDWNDFQGQFLRRIQAGTLDTVGQDVYPAALPNSFLIQANLNSSGAPQILIGAGRMYVDGLLAENHGPALLAQWDPVLAELSNTYPGAGYVGVDYINQPYYPNPIPAAPSAGPYVVYLDVWQREVTYLEDPNLVEIAVGVDTTGRLQTVWQVKLLDVSSATTPVTCSTPPASIPGWQSAKQSSGGQLTTATVQSTPSGPCSLTPNSGYTGMENQFYRVEIHQPGGWEAATFKWSRDNASVMTAVTGINNSASNIAGNTTSALTVQSLGRDQVLGFSAGDWIELIDDYLELNGLPGELHLIDSVTPSTKTITLVSSIVNQPNFPLTNGLTNPCRHTRIRRWDQQGTVYQSDYKTVVVTLGQGGNGGDIPLSAQGIVIVLENGITVSFSLNPSLGPFKTGDFWTFAARTSNNSVEIITNAPPRGIHHHYAILAVVTSFPSSPMDCRTEWPQPSASAACCDCTIMIQPSDVNDSTTLQDILNQFVNLSTNTIICLQPGVYRLSAPLQLTSAHSNITLQACQPETAVLVAVEDDDSGWANGMIVLDGVTSFTLSGISFDIPTVPFVGTSFAGLPLTSLTPDISSALGSLVVSIGVWAINCESLTIRECSFSFGFERKFDGGANDQLGPANTSLFGAAVFASGSCGEFRMERNTIRGYSDFLAGFLMAPSVSFWSPPVISVETRSVEKQASQLDLAKQAGPANPAASISIPARPEAETIFVNANNLPNYVMNGGSVLASSLDDAVFRQNVFENLTVAALVLGVSDAIDFNENEVDSCRGGLWLLSPSMAPMLNMDSRNLAGSIATLAMGYPLPVSDSNPTQISGAPQPILVYTGSKLDLEDNSGNIWLPEASVPSLTITGGNLSHPTPVPSISNALPDQSDAALYESERWGDFTYTFSVPTTGFYQVTLKFAEIFFGASGLRIFDVSINGCEVLSEFDIFADAGGKDIADDKVFNNIVPVNGQIVIEFTQGSGQVNWPKISAVEIEAQWDGLIPNSYFSQQDYGDFYSGEVKNFFGQLTQLGQQAFASLAIEPFRLRLDDNEMTGLKSVAFLILWDDQVQNGRISSLMMAGNRLDTTNSIEASASLSRANASFYFYSVATVALVTRCVASGNMLLNEGVKTGPSNDADRSASDRVSLIVDATGDALDYSAANMSYVAGPLPELSVTGNVLQGLPIIYPVPVPATKTADTNSETR